MNDPQTTAALGIVALTVLIFGYKILRKKPNGCGGGCSCSVKSKVEGKSES